MWFPKKYHYNLKTKSVMKELNVGLNVTTASDVRKMSQCPKNSESQCGIMYRQF